MDENELHQKMILLLEELRDTWKEDVAQTIAKIELARMQREIDLRTYDPHLIPDSPQEKSRWYNSVAQALILAAPLFNFPNATPETLFPKYS